MERKNYENNKWYPLTDEEYWVEELSNEFPNCYTIVYSMNNRFFSNIKTYQSCPVGWGTMAKNGNFYFMIIEKPEITSVE